jgi:hypothetical protein
MVLDQWSNWLLDNAHKAENVLRMYRKLQVQVKSAQWLTEFTGNKWICLLQYYIFLGTSAKKFWKVTINSICMSAWNNMWKMIIGFSLKFVTTCLFWLNVDKATPHIKIDVHLWLPWLRRVSISPWSPGYYYYHWF